jgi:hypothetical protein
MNSDSQSLILLSGATPEYITHAEFQRESTATRDRIGACCVALADKLDTLHHELLAVLERQTSKLEHRLAQLDANFSRLEEHIRLKTSKPFSPSKTS